MTFTLNNEDKMATKKKKTKVKATKSKAANNAVALSVRDGLTSVQFSKQYFSSKQRKTFTDLYKAVDKVAVLIDGVYNGEAGGEHPELRIYLESYRNMLSLASEMTRSFDRVEVLEAGRAVQLVTKK